LTSPLAPYITALLFATVPAIEPSNKFISAAVEDIAEPPISKIVAFTSPPEPYTTTLLLKTVPAVEPSNKFISAAVEDIAEPPNFNLP